MKSKTVKIYTDGACSGNPGKGGWGVVLIYNETIKELGGGEQLTTNNRMELQAVIEGLSALKFPCNIELYSDSAYVINAFNNGWLKNWRQKNWRTSKGEHVKNIELWEKLIELSAIHDITWIKVKGHSDNTYNNRCDEIARSEILKLSDY